MKILKKFDSYVKENIEEEPKPNQTDFTNEISDEVEYDDNDTYIGTKLLNDLAKALGTEVVDNDITYNGQTINFFSETEKFHIGKKTFSTVEEVLDFLKSEDKIEESFDDEEISRELSDEEDDEYNYRVKNEKPDWMWKEEEEFDNEIDSFEKDEEDSECVPCASEHRITKRFKDFK